LLLGPDRIEASWSALWFLCSIVGLVAQSAQLLKRRFQVKIMSDRLAIAAACIAIIGSSVSYAQQPPSESGAHAASADVKAERKADRALALAVRTQLGKSLGFDVSAIAVKAKGGAITLSGSVPTEDERNEAETVARGIQGVSSVTNNLRVLHRKDG
jgi:hyperosmotically inducible protein